MVAVEQGVGPDLGNALETIFKIDVEAMEVNPDEAFRITHDPETLEIAIESDLTLEDFERGTDPRDWALFMEATEGLEGLVLSWVNSTKIGGGVAMLRPALVHLLKLRNIDAHWFVMNGPQDTTEGYAFDFTKLMHNISQRVAGDKRITEQGKRVHNRWAVGENWPTLSQQPGIQNADVLILDDPQTAPLAPLVNPETIVGWRCHIDMDGNLMADPTTPQGEVADYIFDECGVGPRAAFIMSHPVEKFVHRKYGNKYYFAPATIDQHDALNEDLSPEQVLQGIEFINEQIARHNEVMIAAGRPEDVQEPLSTNPNKLLISDITRFDESKAKDRVIALGAKTRQKMREKLLARGVDEADIEDLLPDVITTGNGSIDDTSGDFMYDKILRDRRELPEEDRKATRVIRLPHNQRAVNGLMHATDALVIASTAEGCETRCTDARRRGKVVVVPSGNGVHLQVEAGISAYVLDYSRPDFDLDGGAEFLAELFTNPDLLQQAQQDAQDQYQRIGRREFSTVSNAIRTCRIIRQQLRNPGTPADRVWRISEMVEAAEASRAKGQAIGEVAVS